MLAVQSLLAESERWPACEIEAWQDRQIAALLRHAGAEVPFYRERLPLERLLPDGERLDRAAFAALPLLQRRDLQTRRAELSSRRLPPGHGDRIHGGTSGSSGTPLRTENTGLGAFLHQSLLVRDHLWHRRELRGKLATIQTRVEDGTSPTWNDLLASAFETGPLVRLNARHDVAVQAAWLAAQDPDYLLVHPTIAGALARHCREHGIRLRQLREVRTFGEQLPPGLRETVREAWGVPVADAYSCAEAGTIALQCPEHERYHVQSEAVRLELLREDGSACRPGEIGRVVLTPLHNFAMPLVRYDLIDYAELGRPCPCGRGLPVLERIMGRQRNMIVVPDGRRIWPRMAGFARIEDRAIRQWQVVQEVPDELVLRQIGRAHV